MRSSDVHIVGKGRRSIFRYDTYRIVLIWWIVLRYVHDNFLSNGLCVLMEKGNRYGTCMSWVM